jgi:hypothetical protein
MSAAMTFTEFGNIVKYIRNNNTSTNMLDRTCPVIKYIDPHLDMRTNDVFSIMFRGFGWERRFHCVNECRDLPESLHDRIMTFLTTPGYVGQGQADVDTRLLHNPDF